MRVEKVARNRKMVLDIAGAVGANSRPLRSEKPLKMGLWSVCGKVVDNQLKPFGSVSICREMFCGILLPVCLGAKGLYKIFQTLCESVM